MDRLAYSPKQACFLLNISPAHFYRLVKKQRLAIYKEGRKTRVAAEELRRYVMSRSTYAAGSAP
jgi:excisionase family DNA binding protein